MKITAPQAIARSHRRVLEVTRWLEQVRAGEPPAPWLAGRGTLTCDGGALAAALIAARVQVPARLCVGLYWHTDPVLRTTLMGDRPSRSVVAYVQATCMDEHHHWVLLWPEGPDPILVDPNGPVRREPYVQYAGPAGDRYVPLPPGPGRDLVYNPDDDWAEIAEDVYPGLLAELAAAQPVTWVGGP